MQATLVEKCKPLNFKYLNIMMKKFLLIVCGSFVGVWLALTFFVITTVIGSFAIIGMSASGSTPKVTKHSILHINLSGDIAERSGSTGMDFISLLNGNTASSPALNVMVKAIEEANDNDNIDGIYLECDGLSASPATLMALRKALTAFKGNGKFIYAYGHAGYSQDDYYIASVADSIFLNPVGSVDVHGLSAVNRYPKRLLDKVGVEMQVVRVGTFKSAVEPYMVEEMSDANRLQQEVYMGNIWKSMADSIAASRNIPIDTFNSLVNGVVACMTPDSLIMSKLVDRLVYRDEMESLLKKLTEVDDDDDLNLVDAATLAPNVDAAKTGDKIAVLYAVGEIDPGKSLMSQGDAIVSDDIIEQVKDLAKDDDVKGLVLRVNSPGGSAFGSEQIWKALEDFKKTGKPYAVSMGDYAASGGYYISSGAQRIFAEPTTITGSIGIFGMIPCLQDLLEKQLDLRHFVVKTNENADMGVISQRLTPVQRAALQHMVEEGYDLFTKRCADGRKMTQDSIKLIAEGRVWDAVSARNIGLVDEFGGIDDAVKWVAKQAKLKADSYEVQNYPGTEDKWQKMLKNYMVMQYEQQLQGEMGFLYEYHKQLTRMLNRDHILCIMEIPTIQ